MVTWIEPRTWSPVVFFHHSQYSGINCTLRTSTCISTIFVALHLQNKSSGIRAYIVLCCRTNDYLDIKKFVQITVKYMAKPLGIGCCGSARSLSIIHVAARRMRFTAGVNLSEPEITDVHGITQIVYYQPKTSYKRYLSFQQVNIYHVSR